MTALSNPFPKMPDFISAMERLNSWIRSSSGKRGLAPHRAIYYLKREVIEWAHRNLTVHHHNVRVVMPCRGCEGTGRYIDSWGNRFNHHWECGSLGRQRLEFVQTSIQNGPTWHSPWNTFYISGFRGPDWQLAIADQSWRPNQPGIDMTPDEVARDLNLLETTFTKRPGDYYTDWGGPWNHFRYSLYIGNTGEPVRRCSFCGIQLSDRACGFGVNRDGLEWTDYACDPCQKKVGGGLAVFGAFPVPAQLVTPAIQAWQRRQLIYRQQSKRNGDHG